MALAGCTQNSDAPAPRQTRTITVEPEPTQTATQTATQTTTQTTTTRTANTATSAFTGTNQPPPEPEKNVFDCNGQRIVEAHATHGEDTNLSGMSWAVLKTGFRFAVAWQSTGMEAGTLRYQVGGKPWQEARELAPRDTHLIVLDGLTEGETLCFEVVSGAAKSAMHAVRLGNAMNAYDEVYTLNLLVLANEGSDPGNLVKGMVDYGNILFDSTDGHVRAGRTIIITNDALHHNSGWASCYVAFLVLNGNTPTCNRVFDAIFTNDAYPGGAASTYLDGIEDPKAAIWMNWVWQGTPTGISLDRPGLVLTHELGHYVFGMQDMYTSGECWNAALELSIMGSNRNANEFDDRHNRCPNAGQLSGYEPSWESARKRFPELPDRDSIDPGPAGDGGVHMVHLYNFV
jgi:hypothetical protein